MKTLIFDFDGVFTDSFDFTLTAFQKLHEKFKLPPIKSADVVDLFCTNLWEAHKRYNLEEETEEAFKNELLALVGSRQYEIPFFPGVAEVIRSIASQRNKMIIISSNKSSSVQEKLESIHLESAFSQILGADRLGNKKEKMSKVLEEGGEVFFITDTVGDLKEVGDLPIKTIAVTWGYHSRELLLAAHPDFMIDTPEELLKILVI